MHAFTHYNPVRLIFGAGSIAHLGELAAEHGRHALLVTGRGAARATGLLERATDLLESAGLRVTHFDRVTPNPTAALVDEGAARARAAGCDVVVAVGGGSAMDAAKAIAVGATHDAPIADFLRIEGKLLPTAATLPIICATTTAGTSSELTRFAVITVEEFTQKSAIASDFIYPRASIVDPELTLTCPPEITAGVGVDVLAHAIEGYFSTAATPISDLCAERAIELVARNLPRAVHNGADLEARDAMSLANVFAGYTLATAGGSVVHALEHPISAHYPQIAHGVGLAALMIAYAERCFDRDPVKFGKIARLMGRGVVGGRIEDSAEFAPDAIRALLDQVGLNVSLAEIGVEREKLPTIVDDALRYMGEAVRKTPVDFTRAELIELLEASFGSAAA